MPESELKTELRPELRFQLAQVHIHQGIQHASDLAVRGAPAPSSLKAPYLLRSMLQRAIAPFGQRLNQLDHHGMQIEFVPPHLFIHRHAHP